MNKQTNASSDSLDPLGLRALPAIEPPADGWNEVHDALTNQEKRHFRQRFGVAALATAASAVLAVMLLLNSPSPSTPSAEDQLATIQQPTASDEQDQTLKQLIAMSQNLEQQLRGLRTESGSMPGSSAVYVAELEDLVAQVDNQISVSPDSLNLWGQRVNLLLDLAQIYQHEWEREYGRMASL